MIGATRMREPTHQESRAIRVLGFIALTAFAVWLPFYLAGTFDGPHTVDSAPASSEPPTPRPSAPPPAASSAATSGTVACTIQSGSGTFFVNVWSQPTAVSSTAREAPLFRVTHTICWIAPASTYGAESTRRLPVRCRSQGFTAILRSRTWRPRASSVVLTEVRRRLTFAPMAMVGIVINRQMRQSTGPSASGSTGHRADPVSPGWHSRSACSSIGCWLTHRGRPGRRRRGQPATVATPSLQACSVLSARGRARSCDA
ncbi:hypothetical protein EV378_6780 [Pseudonocardia endophytica]|uniref:Uncharacterized protein n=1 Tax=Pseudonocardia endophytica TaxID=401976 RepID=A0A4R1HNJ7_PSEEN|nr:hypothetical protein EV378_6780 [Pseudonocardia endophytica]